MEALVEAEEAVVPDQVVDQDDPTGEQQQRQEVDDERGRQVGAVPARRQPQLHAGRQTAGGQEHGEDGQPAVVRPLGVPEQQHRGKRDG